MSLPEAINARIRAFEAAEKGKLTAEAERASLAALIRTPIRSAGEARLKAAYLHDAVEDIGAFLCEGDHALALLATFKAIPPGKGQHEAAAAQDADRFLSALITSKDLLDAAYDLLMDSLSYNEDRSEARLPALVANQVAAILKAVREFVGGELGEFAR